MNFGGDGSSSATGTTTDPTDPAFSASGSGNSDLGSLLSNLSQAFAPSGVTANSPAAAVNAVTQATDPTGTIAAQNAITGGQQAPAQQQTQNPQGGGDGGQQGANQQFAPPSAVDALKKALQGLTQQQRQNPYGFPTNVGNAAAGQNSPMLNRATRIPTGQVPPAPANPANIPSGDAQEAEFMNDNPPPPNSTIDPADAVRAGLKSDAPDTGFRIPGQPANTNEAGPNFSDYLNNLRGNVTQPATPIEGLPPAGDPSTLIPGGGGELGGLAGIARRMGLLPAIAGTATDIVNPTPLQQATGVEAPRTLGRSPSGPDPITPALGGGPGNEEEAPTGTPVTKAPETGKPIKTVDPKTGKPVDPKTGDPLPTKKGDLPTHVDQDGHGPIARDMGGVSTGVPQGLGQLAQIAMPLLMMAMGGMGGGRRGRGGFRGGGFGRHFHGGGGHWPYHHPQFGWQTHGGHPGGGWKPMHPRDFHEFRRDHATAYGGDGNQASDDPAVQAIMQALGGGQQQKQQGQGGRSGFGGQQGGNLSGGQAWAPPAGGGGGTPITGNPQTGSADDVLATIRQRESSGQNVEPWEGHSASGYYQIQPKTWAAWARDSGDTEAAQYPEAYKAPQAVQDRMARWALQKYGANATYTWAASGPALGRPYPNVDPNSFAVTKPGTTATGGSKGPNPDGNPATTDTTPPYTPPAPTQMGAEGGAQA